MTRAALLALALMALAACGKPSGAELAGAWVDPVNHARLVLSRDGIARLTGWPLSKVFDSSSERRVSARGHWSSAHATSADPWPHALWSFDLTVDRIDDGTGIDRGKPNGIVFGWCDFWRCIRAVRGDPDTHDELVFFKLADEN